MATISAALAIAIEHHRAGRLAAAAQIYRQILQAEPEQADAWHLQGVIAHQIRQHAAAVDCIGRAIAANPHVAEYHNNLGVALRELGRIDEAAACYRRAVELNPDYAEAHNNLGNVLKNQGDFAGAAAGFQRALQLSPDYAEAHSNLATLIKDQGQPDESLAGYRRAAELRPDAAEIGSNLLYALQYCPGYTAQDIYAEHCRWSRRHAQPPAGFVQPHGNDRSPGRRLRVGYVSPDFREHCLAQVAGPLLAAHDHQNFEIFCYADVTCPDQATARLRGCADVWRDIVGLTAQQGAALVREDRIDVLVDLTMHMAHNHLLLFAHKPAPVQVCWFAYPGTTGLSTIDYRLTDPHLDPPGLSDGWYSERSIHLPDSFWCYDPQASQAAVNSLPAERNGWVTFGSLNNFCKVNASVLDLWARVLKAVDRSRLMLLAAEGSHRGQALERLQRGGVAPDRVIFVRGRPRPQYLELYHDLDLGLDTFPYNGHTTSLDSLWMGVPVITLAGRTVVGRAGVSLLRNVGLPELIADTPDRFVDLAAAWAADLPRLGQLRATLRDRLSRSPLMDAPRFARNVEAAYRRMWQRWAAAPPPG